MSVVGETTVEPHENFFVNISNLSGGGTITDAQGEVTILNDDSARSVVDRRRLHGRGQFRLDDRAPTGRSRSPRPSGSAVTVDFATADDTATAGTDYTATTGTLTFAPGVTVRGT